MWLSGLKINLDRTFFNGLSILEKKHPFIYIKNVFILPFFFGLDHDKVFLVCALEGAEGTTPIVFANIFRAVKRFST